MNWNHVGTGLALVAIGLALLLAPLPPTWWPNMSKGLIQTTFAAGLLIFVGGLGLLVIGTSPVLHDRSLWPQTGMVLSILAFIFFSGWYFFESSPASDPPQEVPPLSLSLVIDSLNNDEPNFHLEVENLNGPQVEIHQYAYKTPKFSGSVILSEERQSIIPKSGKITLPGKMSTGIATPPTTLDVALNYSLSKTPTVRSSGVYRFFIDHSVRPPERFLPVLWKQGQIPDLEKFAIKSAFEELHKPTGSIYLALPERRPDGFPNIVRGSTKDRRFFLDPTTRKVQFVSLFKMVETTFGPTDSGIHVLTLTWNDSNESLSLTIDGKEVRK
jgi:hypothetical protein